MCLGNIQGTVIGLETFNGIVPKIKVNVLVLFDVPTSFTIQYHVKFIKLVFIFLSAKETNIGENKLKSVVGISTEY